jgi:hypothetical protein
MKKNLFKPLLVTGLVAVPPIVSALSEAKDTCGHAEEVLQACPSPVRHMDDAPHRNHKPVPTDKAVMEITASATATTTDTGTA